MSVTLAGTITAAAAPVSGATVGAYSAATGLLVGSAATTDGAGAYSLSLAAGVYKLRVQKSGYPVTWHGASSFAGATETLLASGTVTVNVALFAAPASGYSLGEVALWVESFGRFVRDPTINRVRLLSDGTTTNNESLQSGALGRRSAAVSLPWVEDADLTALLEYFDNATQVWCVTPEESLYVVVADLAAPQVCPGVWSVTMTLVEAPL